MPALDADTLHPRLRAAMQRDGIQLYYLAALVGLDARTVRRWGVADSDSRAPAFRRLEDWIAGRARAVELEREDGERAWALEHLGERGIPPAEVARMLEEVDARWREWASAVVAGVQQATNRPPPDPPDVKHAQPCGLEQQDEKVARTGLRREPDGPITGGMNDAVIKKTAHDVWSRSRGQGLVSLHKKVPKDQLDRLEAAAKSMQMDSSDYLRAMLEIYLPRTIAPEMTA